MIHACSRIGAQKKHSLSTVVRNVASVVGIALGCILGMLPLLFVDEEKKQLRALFDSIDVNGDGTISQTELRACLKGLGLEVRFASLPQERVWRGDTCVAW